tara:strand:- start:1310 stop:1492 length:183 start_codon:yes stop_codon:yes gene_type:complete
MKDKILNKLLELESDKNTETEQEMLDTIIDVVLNIRTLGNANVYPITIKIAGTSSGVGHN